MSGPAPRITRRTMLGGAAAAGAGALLGPAASAASAAGAAGAAGAPSLAGNIFETWVGHLDGRSATLVAPARFALAGLQWRGSAHERMKLRTRTLNGSWSPWALASVTGHDSNAAAAEPDQQFGEPLWVRAADLIQLRSAGPVEGVRVHYVAQRADTAKLATAASLPLAQPILDAGPGQPPIIARAAWARGHAPPEGSAYYGSIRLAFVHHTVNPNGYSAGEVPSLLLAIFDYHGYVRRLLRHRLRLHHRRLRPDLGGPGGRHRRAGGRRPTPGPRTPSRPGRRCWARSRRWCRRCRHTVPAAAAGLKLALDGIRRGQGPVVVDPAYASRRRSHSAPMSLPRVAVTATAT